MMRKVSLYMFSTDILIFVKYFNPWLVEFEDAEPMDVIDLQHF
jgi:hypothetical protein